MALEHEFLRNLDVSEWLKNATPSRPKAKAQLEYGISCYSPTRHHRGFSPNPISTVLGQCKTCPNLSLQVSYAQLRDWAGLSCSPTSVTPPVLGVLEGSIPAITVRAASDDPSVVVIDHVLEKKFEGRRNVRVVTCGLHEFHPDDCICFCVARLPHDVVDDAKQGGVSIYG